MPASKAVARRAKPVGSRVANPFGTSRKKQVPFQRPPSGVRALVKQQVDRLDFDILLCRDLKHQWNPTVVNTVRIKGKVVYEQGVKCERCDTEKDRWRDPITGKMRSRMRYVPERYLLHESGFLSREERAYIQQAWMEHFGITPEGEREPEPT